MNNYKISVKDWVKSTNAIGLKASAGRYGGTYARADIALGFGMWISAEFKVYLIKEFQRLKEEESKRLSLDWNLHRTLTKVNYRIHTDAIKDKIIPPQITKKQQLTIYTDEADLLNVALYGKTAKEWRKKNINLMGNIRDHSSLEQLLVLSNLESMNAEFIRMGLNQGDRLNRLNEIAIVQAIQRLKK